MFHLLSPTRRTSGAQRVAGNALKCFLAVTLFCTTVFTAQAQPIDSLYGRKVVTVDEALILGPMAKELKGGAEDMVRVLSQMTRQEFTLAPTTGAAAAALTEGIFLVPTASTLAPADAVAALKDDGREPFIIRSSDAKKLWIIANGGEGLSHGLYYYLELLGVRWLNPGEAWEFIPSRTSIGGRISSHISPTYKLRNFYGSGGFSRGLPVDPTGANEARWQRYKWRNRFGGEYALGGHSGEGFNTEKKAILLEHPEYLATVGGKQQPYSIITKLNVSNPDVVKLYVDWTVERLVRTRKNNPNTLMVSVDPSDGGGHCECAECKKIGNGSSSDLVYFVANQAAKAVAKAVPGAWVNLYAYHEHAAPPSFPLEPNVYISLIPYAFQRTGLSPEEFIKVWGRKTKRIGMYDYWSIPDWSTDYPSFDFVRTPRSKIRFWRDNNVEGFSAESTYSGGAMGPGWYVASRLMWNPDQDDAAVLTEWFDYSFGPAKTPMRRMTERWAAGFSLIGNELALSYRDLVAAKALAKDRPDVLARLADYGRYLEYLRLRYVYDVSLQADKKAAHHALLRHVWRIYHSSMIHSFRLHQLLVRGNTEMAEAYPLLKKDNPVWKELGPIPDNEVFAMVEAGARDLPLLDYEVKRYTGELVPLPKNLLPAVAAATDETPYAMTFVGHVNLSVQIPAGVKAIKFQIGSKVPARVQLTAPDGKILYDKPTIGGIDISQKNVALEDVAVPVPVAGKYRLAFKIDKNTNIRLALPRDLAVTLLPFAVSKGTGSPPLYFFVPKGLKIIAIYDAIALPEFMQPRLWTPAGVEVKPQVFESRRILLYPVPPGEDGKVWKIARIVAPNWPIDIMNAANTFAFTPEALNVPKDALPLPGG